MNVKDIIKNRRLQLNLTMKELSDKVGVSEGTISRWESGEIQNMRRDKVLKLSSALNLEPGDIMGWDKSKIKSVRIPVIGMVHAGIPTDATEDIIDWEEITPDIASKGEILALKVNGDCMEPKISEGDVIIVLAQSDCECGDTVVIMVNSHEAMLRKIKKFNDGSINLVPSNPNYPVDRFSRGDIISLPVRIIGKVIELRAKF